MADYSDILEQAGRQFNVDPKLLALVMRQESGGNAGAVSSKGARGPMQVMPGTAKDMGVTNQADPVQNIMAGAKYLSQQLDKYKDPALALAAYNAGPGAVDKHGGVPPFPETQGYVKSIMAAYQGGQGASGSAAPQSMPGLPPTAGGRPAPGAQLADADPFSALMAKAGAAPTGTSKAAQAAPHADPFSQLMAKADASNTAPAAAPHQTSITDLPGAAVEPLATLATGALGGIAGGATRLGAAALGKNFDEAKGLGDRVQNALTYQPQTEGGKASIAGLGEIASKAKNALMDSPVGSALSSAGKAYENTFVKGSTNPLMATVNDMVPGVAANVVAGKLGGAALDAAKAAPGAVRAGLDRAASAVGRGQPAPAAAAAPAPPVATLSGVGAASANLNPYPALTGEVAARGGSSAFPQVKLSQIQKDVPLDEQAVRAKIANEILGDDHGKVREGVITGNEDTLRSEYTHANSSENTPAQILLRQQIAKEQQALTDFSEARIEATGANPNLTNNYQRGQVINDAFHGEGGLSDYFKQAKQELYDRAKAESGGNPIQSAHVDNLLADKQFMAEAKRNGHTGVVEGVRDLIDLARTTGFKDPLTGEVHAPGSVGAWDAVRKSNNAGWSPDNARTIAAINRAIDQDVVAAAGSDAYKMGDALHKAEKTIMDTPAISEIFGGADANGIKDGAAMEKLPTLLNNMSIDKWTHIHNTLDDLSRGIVRGAPEGMPAVPQDLRDLAAAAKAEMHGALAREVYEKGAGKAGVWNQNDANKALNSVVGQKIINTFDPDEVQRFHTLNLGGQIMPGKHSYEGSELQKIRMSKPGLIEKHAGKAGAVAGGAMGAAINPWLGGPGTQSGAVLGAKIAGRSASKRLEGESNKLLDAMKANSKLGRQGEGNRLTGH
jgi:hypothetical protein